MCMSPWKFVFGGLLISAGIENVLKFWKTFERFEFKIRELTY